MLVTRSLSYRLFHISLCLGLLSVVTFLSPVISFADEISIVADEWCPYNCEPGSENPGYIIEIAQKVFSAAGHQVVYANVNWARAIREARSGKYSAIVGAIVSDAPDFIYPTLDQGVTKSCFFKEPHLPWMFKGIDSMNEVKIGVINDYSYGDVIDGYIETGKASNGVQVVGGDNPLKLNVNKILKGRIDVLLEDPAVLGFYLKAEGKQDKLVNAGCTEGDPLFASFSPSNKASASYAKLLSEGMANMRADGRLKAILDKYGVQDWK